jgi:RES domain
MPLRRPDPGTFEHLLRPVQVTMTSMVRMSRHPSTEPWWSRTASCRFDDALPLRTNQFGVCYAGDSVETAFAESVIHESGLFEGGRYKVAQADLAARWKVHFRHPKRKRLRLADLTGEPLKALRLNNDICSGDDYTLPQLWSRAIHDCDSRWDGIRHVARQNNSRYAYALFERKGLQAAQRTRLDGPELDALCDRFGVDSV